MTEKDKSLSLHNNHFCFIWKSEGVSFIKAIKEVKDNFEIFHNFITEENVNSHFQHVFIPKKIESHLTKIIVYDLETIIQIELDHIVFHFID